MNDRCWLRTGKVPKAGGMRLQIIAAIAGALALAGCGSVPPPAPDYQPSLVDHYILDSGDRLRVIVFNQADLSNSYVVDKGGYVAMPLIGPVPARGRTPQELEADIAARLRASYLRDPDVSLEVEEYRPFFIMGEVNAGGQYAYVDGLTVQAAIAVAGGYTPRANLRFAEVTRQVDGRISTFRLELTDPVRPGDTVTVRERLF
jgi:polysaccharide export outer membrane protein